MRTHATQVVRLEAADEPDFREMNDSGALSGGVIEELEWCPALRAQAEEIDPELDGRRVCGSLRRERRDSADDHHFPPRHAAIVSFGREAKLGRIMNVRQTLQITF